MPGGDVPLHASSLPPMSQQARPGSTLCAAVRLAVGAHEGLGLGPFVDHEVALVPLDDAFDVRVLVAGHDDETVAVGPHALVVGCQQVDEDVAAGARRTRSGSRARRSPAEPAAPHPRRGCARSPRVEELRSLRSARRGCSRPRFYGSPFPRARQTLRRVARGEERRERAPDRGDHEDRPRLEQDVHDPAHDRDRVLQRRRNTRTCTLVKKTAWP